ncbi:MAG TPA: hypothetical protein VK908_00745 [Jiangellales bacterium]|nr:hypothetical protein [Jiangellales bacterium]
MYEEIAGWEADEPARDQVPEMRAFAEVWRSIDKVVDSLTREDVSTARTRIERTFDTDAVRRLKLAAERDQRERSRAGRPRMRSGPRWPTSLCEGPPERARARRLAGNAIQAAEWSLWIEPLDEDGAPRRELRLGFDTGARLLETVVLGR